MSTKHKIESQQAASTTMDVAQAVALIDQVIAALALTPSTLTAKQKKEATRSRKGMEKVVPTLASLSVEHGVNVPKQPTSVMTSNLELVTKLTSVQTKLVSLETLVSNAIDGARSESWNTATTLYGMLQKAAHRDAGIKSQLAPVTEFFAYRHPSVRKEHPKQKGKKDALKAQKQAAAEAAASQQAEPSKTASSEATSSDGSTTASTDESAAKSGATTSNAVASQNA
jgi:hypothetical protein